MNWKKTVRTTLFVAIGILVLLAGAADVIVRTRAFNQFVLEKIIQEARATTGARIDIQRVEIHWRKLGVDFYGMVVYGSGGASEPPLFRGDHLAVGLKIVSVLERKVDLAEVILDRPVLDIRVNSKGVTNLPKSPSASKNADPVATAFDMAVGHVLVNSGQIDYNDQQIPISADVRDLRAEVNFGVFTRNYTGSIGYGQGRLVANGINPIDHSAQLKFTATRSELDIDPVILAARNSRITAHVKLTDYASPDIQGNYDAFLVTREIAQMMKNPSLPDGQITVAGRVRYQTIPGAAPLNRTYVDGGLTSPRLVLRANQISTEATSVRGAFSFDRGNLRISNVEADVLQGHLNADGEMLNLGGSPSTRVNAKLMGVQLESISNAIPRRDLDGLRLMGRANVDAQLSWSNRVENILVHSHVTIAAPPQTQSARRGIPLNGVLDVRYDGAHDTASFGQSHLQTGNTQISLAGTVSKQSNLSIQANTTDLREVTALVSEMSAATANPAASGALFPPLDLRGTAHFSGQVSGAVKDPRLHGQLTASDIQVEGSQWRSIQTSVDLASSRIALQNGILESAPRGQLNFTASAALNHWSFTPASPLSIQATGANLSVAALEHLAEQHYPVDGTLSANISVAGTKQHPTGRGSVQITKATAWSEPVNNLSVNFDANGSSITSTEQLQLPAGNVSANLTFSPDTEQYDAKVDTSGLKLDQIQAVQTRDWGVAGLLTASVHGQGSLKDPQLSTNLRVSQFRFRDQSISGAEASFNIAHQHANFTLHSVIAQGNLDAKGDVTLTGDYDTTATMDIRALPIGALLANYISGSSTNLQGQTEIHAELNGPLKNPARLQAHIEIPSFSLAYQSMSIALVRPLRLDYRQGTATLQETELKGTGTDVKLQGVIPVKSSSTSFNVAANGTMDLSLLQGFTRGVKSSGRIDLQVAGRGDFKNPTMHGQVKVENAYFSSDSSPLGIEGVNGQVNLSGRRLEVTELTGKAGGGTLSVQGFMVYGAPSNFNLSLQANSVRLRYPEGLRSILHCNLQLNGTTAASNLTGRVLIDRLSFTQQFDLASFTAQMASGSSFASASTFEQNMRLSVAVQSAQDLNLASSQLSMQGAANLNVTGTLANPVILGRITLTGGDIFFLGKRYEVQNGAIEFSNPVETEPVVNLYITTAVQQYNITLNLMGSVDRLKTTYTSDPPLPPADIINLLALGVTAEESATNATPTSVSAESIVAQGVASQVSGKIQKLAGISQLTIDPLASGNTTDPGAQVSIQQRVTGNILLTFSTDVTSTQATTVQLQYRTSRQTSVSVLRDQNGGYAVDFRIHKTF